MRDTFDEGGSVLDDMHDSDDRYDVQDSLGKRMDSEEVIEWA